MTRTTKRFLALYFALLLALSVLGASNQKLYWQETNLIAQKDQLHLTLSGLRRQASGVSGALAVRQWAYAKGMIPATEADVGGRVAAMPAPQPGLSEPSLEVRTQWR